MNYFYAILVVVILSLIFVLGYYFNSKIEIECDKSECENCKIESCYHKINKED